LDRHLDRTLVHISPSADGVLVVAPFPGDQWRLIASVPAPPGNRCPEPPTRAEFDEYLSARGRSGARVSEIGWRSSFRIHDRLADVFVRDRVALVGDAAHVHSPAGGLGMNTGIQDALDAAATIATAELSGSDEPFEGFTRRRMAAARQVSALSGRLTRTADPISRLEWALRRLALQTGARLPVVRRRVALEISCVSRAPRATGVRLPAPVPAGAPVAEKPTRKGKDRP